MIQLDKALVEGGYQTKMLLQKCMMKSSLSSKIRTRSRQNSSEKQTMEEAI